RRCQPKRAWCSLAARATGGRRLRRSSDPILSLRGRRTRRALAGLSMIAVLVLVVVVLPPRFTAHQQFDNAADELKAQNDVRTSLLQTLGGLLLATGVYLTWRQMRLPCALVGCTRWNGSPRSLPLIRSRSARCFCAYVRTPPI